MRHTFLIMVVAALGGGFALASCGGNGKSNGDMGADLAGSGAPLDMVMTKANCEGVGTAFYNCILGGGTFATCATQVQKNAKPGSFQKWANALTCGQSYCVGDADMMTGKCVEVLVPGDMSVAANVDGQLCDPGTTYAQCSAATYVSTSCTPCLDNAYDIWFLDDTDPTNPGMPTFNCLDPTSPDCTGAQAACMTQFNACRNDM